MDPAVDRATVAAQALPYVADFDDAEFHRYDRHRFAPVRSLLGKKIDGVMRGA